MTFIPPSWVELTLFHGIITILSYFCSTGAGQSTVRVNPQSGNKNLSEVEEEVEAMIIDISSGKIIFVNRAKEDFPCVQG